MTGRERIVAAARGGEVDRTPVLLWGSWSESADACAVPFEDFQHAETTACLAIVHSPLTRALQAGFDLNQAIADDPASGNERLDAWVVETKEQAARALDQGADGIAYVLDGAYPAATTPMQFGGLYLERDREILEEIRDARFNAIWIEGTGELYLDSVSDLPADALGWRMSGVDFGISAMRELRPGLLFGDHAESDIRLAFHPEQLLTLHGLPA